MIFHVVEESVWEARQHESELATPGPEGFVHCCEQQQLAHVRATYFAADVDVVALGLDPTQLDHETRYEPGSLGEPERFPHVYGPIATSAVVSVRLLTAG
jgi:uncharacterized protein (DUF952 family)